MPDPAALLALEAATDRFRPYPIAPRGRDLIDPDRLVRFVLARLAAVAPGWVHPVLDRTAEDLPADGGRPAPRAVIPHRSEGLRCLVVVAIWKVLRTAPRGAHGTRHR